MEDEYEASDIVIRGRLGFLRTKVLIEVERNKISYDRRRRRRRRRETSSTSC